MNDDKKTLANITPEFWKSGQVEPTGPYNALTCQDFNSLIEKAAVRIIIDSNNADPLTDNLKHYE